MVCLIAVGAWIIAKDARTNRGSLSPAVVGGMLIESICLALVFGIVVGGLTAGLLGAPPPPMVLGIPGERLGRWTLLMLSIGAGIYEELLFRVVLVGLLAWGANKLFGWRPVVAGIVATVLGALIFSAFHYIGPYGDPLDLYSFVFRTIAGLFFSGLYLLRPPRDQGPHRRRRPLGGDTQESGLGMQRQQAEANQDEAQCRRVRQTTEHPQRGCRVQLDLARRQRDHPVPRPAVSLEGGRCAESGDRAHA